TREGEVEIAQRIEAGQEAQMRAVLASPFGLAEVLRLGDELRKGTLGVADLVDLGTAPQEEADEEESEDEEERTATAGAAAAEADERLEERRRALLDTFAELREIDAEVAKRLVSLHHPRTGESARARLRGEIAELLDRSAERLREVRFSAA